jgi:hypothetical protein
MIEQFIRLLKMFTDKEINPFIKIITIVFILSAIYLLNNSLDFVANYRLNNKLTQLEKISILLKDSTLTKTQKDALFKNRIYVLYHQSLLDRLFCLFENNAFSENSKITTQTERIKPSNNSEPNVGVIKNPYLHFIFSNLILIIFVLMIPFFSVNKETNAFGIIAVFVIIYIIGGLVCLLISYLMNLIPIILNRPWLNYILDFLIQLILWLILIFGSNKMQKKKS